MNLLKKLGESPKKPFKLFFWRFFFGYLPIGLFVSSLALFNISPIEFNEEPIYGIKGFFLGLLYIPLSVFAISTIVWLIFILGDFIINFISIFESKEK
jgi:hypothetical protein